MTAVTEPPSMDDVWFCATRGHLADVRRLLAEFPHGERLRSPAAMVLRGFEDLLNGDVRGGVAVLRRAAERASLDERPYVVDLVAPFAMNIGDLAVADQLLSEPGSVPEHLRPAFLAQKSVLATRLGFDEQSRELAHQALSGLIQGAGEYAIVTCKTLQRVGFAAFFRGDYDEAQERSLEAARAYERTGMLRAATHCYSVLYIVASGWLGDPIIARAYAARIADLAFRDGDQSMHHYGLVGQFEVAADAGDIRRLGSIRARLLANPYHQQYRERISYVVAESLSQGWNRNFSVCAAAIKSALHGGDLTSADSMICDAMLALCDVARWDIDEARQRAQSVIQRTAHRAVIEALGQTQNRRIARILAASALILIGDATRGRRALGRGVDPDAYFARLDPVAGLIADRAPPMMKGHALFINAVCATAAEARPRHQLTRAEMEVLQALATGLPRRELAAQLGKAENTVMKQLTAIYAKLEVSGRAQAVQQARELGIIA